MKKTTRLMISLCSLLLLLGALTALCCSCGSKTAKFEFAISDSEVLYSEIVGSHYAQITVTSTCVSGRFYDKEYLHSFEGGMPTLILEDGTGIEGKCELNAAITEVDIRKGDTLEYLWTFDVPSDFEEGAYTVRVEWNGSVQTFENVSFSKAE